MAAAGQELAELKSAIGTARHNRRQRRRPSTIVADWQQDLLTEMAAGWTGPGQTNHLLKTIACYGVVFEGLKGPALATYVQATATQAPGYQQWCSHQHEISQRSQTWANAAEGYYWKLGDAPTRGLGSAANQIKPFPNVQKAEDAQQRIQAAVATLAAAGQLPATATARVKAIAATGINSRTLYRYVELWHPHEIDLQGQPCKIARLDSDLAILEPEFADPPKALEPNRDGKFYTNSSYMKSRTDFSGSRGGDSSSLRPMRAIVAHAVMEQLAFSWLEEGFGDDRENALSINQQQSG